MGLGSRVAARVGALLVVWAFVVPAHAGCSLDDLLNSLENTVSAINSGSCAEACADGVGCGAVVALTGVLAGVSTDAGQNTVNQICSGVQDALNQVNNAQDDANTVLQLLNKYAPTLSQAVQQQLAQSLAAVTSALGVATCACAMQQSLNQVDNTLGACIQDALCGLQDLIGDPCNCTPPPPIQANCTLPSTACGWTDHDPACQGDNTILRGPQGYTPPTITNGPGGTFVSEGGDSSDGQGHCSAVSFCFCPKPMVASWQTDYARDSSGDFQIFTCQCPAGTQAAGSTGSLAYTCLCPDGTAVQADGTCHPSLTGTPCPNGEVNIGGQCVKPCSDPTQVQLTGGACCNPSQVTSCGTCCPAGQSPDPATGSCVQAGPNPTPINQPIQ